LASRKFTPTDAFMTKKIRVLVVDDAVVVRRLMGDLLARDPEIEVVGTAATGRIALQKLTQLCPDLVTLDVEMPDMDGLETLRAIRKTHPKLPVIMFSALTARAASAPLDALACGASDYLCKPASGLPAGGTAQNQILSELTLKIRALCARSGRTAAVSEKVPPPRTVVWPTAAEGTPPVSVIAIGVSTGGPQALAAIIPELHVNIPVPILVVQHMPPMFTKLLADRLNSLSAVSVLEVRGGEPLRSGAVYIAPGGSHIVVDREGSQVIAALDQGPAEHSCRPSVDVLFRSVASVFGPRALGVVLTGMGQDGLKGCEALVRAGSRVIVQDEDTSVVWGMPGLVAKAGLADRILPLSEIGFELTRRTSPPSAAGRAEKAPNRW
jgi:two-component system, chemotaxis family, protein-glutamate methylesterase/glutaminase